jgi:hypothetical protein
LRVVARRLCQMWRDLLQSPSPSLACEKRLFNERPFLIYKGSKIYTRTSQNGAGAGAYLQGHQKEKKRKYVQRNSKVIIPRRVYANHFMALLAAAPRSALTPAKKPSLA